MTWIEQSVSYNSEKWKHDLAKLVYDELKKSAHEKEVTTMQVSYNGFTGELVKMERREIPEDFLRDRKAAIVYDLSIYDSEKKVTHSFTGVKLEDVKFMGGAVSFNG